MMYLIIIINFLFGIDFIELPWPSDRTLDYKIRFFRTPFLYYRSYRQKLWRQSPSRRMLLPSRRSVWANFSYYFCICTQDRCNSWRWMWKTSPETQAKISLRKTWDSWLTGWLFPPWSAHIGILCPRSSPRRQKTFPSAPQPSSDCPDFTYPSQIFI